MQFTLATIALFAASAFALPATQAAPVATATISFINDQSGAHAPIVAPLDGTTVNLYNALTGTPVGVPNQVLASSAQLIAYPQNVDCTIKNLGGTVLGELTARKTYVKLNAALPNTPALVNLAGATMQCTANGKVSREE